MAKLAALLLLLMGACMPGVEQGAQPRAEARRGEFSASPQARTGADAPGLREIATAAGEPALLYIPTAASSGKPMPLLVMLHGAGGTARHSVDLVSRHADRLGFVILAPQSRAATWDVIASRGYGPDVAAIDEALNIVVADVPVDPARLAIGGFSDGASYALSLGLINGGLFTDIIAFSPGFAAPGGRTGSPRIFISHGVADRVLPIEACSRRIVPSLRSSGYTIDYSEFPGGHVVPAELAGRAFDTVVTGGAG